MYKILPYTREKAKELGVYIKPSTRVHKKLDIYDGNHQYICSVGDIRYKDFPTYYKERGEEYAERRRKLYYQRHKDYAWGSKDWYAKKLLW
jgi:hypothetical protein